MRHPTNNTIYAAPDDIQILGAKKEKTPEGVFIVDI
jgi:hypothetical protein